MSFSNIDLARFIDGFKVTAEGKEISISKRDVAQAIDGISFKMLPINKIPFIPPTISPCRASDYQDYLEHPIEAFREYKKMGAKKIIGELKHMGSRAVILAFRDKDAALRYTNSENQTIIYTRNGIAFFKAEEERIITGKIQDILARCNYYEKFNTDFVLMDTEILPWNAKGAGLIKNQYLPVLDGSKGLNDKLLNCLSSTTGCEVIKRELETQADNITKFKEQLESYCWNTDISSINIAPFHLLAHEGRTYFDKTHKWHLNHFDELIDCCDDNLFVKTPYIEVDLDDEKSMQSGVDFWNHATSSGFEGVMFKTDTFIERNADGDMILPMMKVRGKDYLRIIYGINYDSEKYLKRLRYRNVSKKRGLHYCQMALSMESVKSFAKGDSFDIWHDFVLASICNSNIITDHRL